MSVTLTTWTLDDYHRMVASGVLDDRPVELLRGEIVEMPPEGEAHAYLITDAIKYMIEMVGERATVRPDYPITLPEHDSEPEPDIAVVRPLGREYLDHHPYPGDVFWLDRVLGQQPGEGSGRETAALRTSPDSRVLGRRPAAVAAHRAPQSGSGRLPSDDERHCRGADSSGVSRSSFLGPAPA